MNTKYGEVRNEEAPLLSQNTRKKSEHSGYTIKAAGAAILLIGSLAVAQSTQQRRTAQGQVRLGDALDDAKAEAAKLRSEAERCKETHDCVEEFGLDVTNALDGAADGLTDIGRDANELMQGVTDGLDQLDALSKIHLPNMQRLRDAKLGEDSVDVVQTVTDAVQDAVETVTDAATDAGDAITDAATDAGDAVSDATDEVVETVTDAAADVTDAVSEIPATVTDAATDASDAVTDAAADAAEAIKSIPAETKKSIEELEASIEQAKADSEAAAADAAACTEDVQACWDKAVDKMEADVVLAKLKAKMWEAKASKAMQDAVAPTEECVEDVAACAKKAQDDAAKAAEDVQSAAEQIGTDIQTCANDVPDCFTQAAKQAKADVQSTTSDMAKCIGSPSDCVKCLSETDPASCIAGLPSISATVQLGEGDVVADALEPLKTAFADAKAQSEAATAKWEACAADIASCASDTEAKAKAKLDADASMFKAKADLMSAEIAAGITDGVGSAKVCASDVVDCSKDALEKAQAKAQKAADAAAACAADGQLCIEKAVGPIAKPFENLAQTELMQKTATELEAVVAETKAAADAAGADFATCVADLVTCGDEKMTKFKTKMEADMNAAQAKAALMSKQVEDKATQNSEAFAQCVGGPGAMKTCITGTLDKAQDDATEMKDKFVACTASVTALQGCFADIGALGTGTDVTSACAPKSSAPGCIDALKDAAAVDLAAAKAKVVALIADSQASVNGVTADMVADAKAIQAAEEARWAACSAAPSWETCKPVIPPTKKTKGTKGYMTGSKLGDAQSVMDKAWDDLKKCVQDIPACWDKAVGSSKAKADEAAAEAEAAVEAAKEDTVKCADDVPDCLTTAAAEAQANAEALAKEAEECAADPQACFKKMQSEARFH